MAQVCNSSFSAYVSFHQYSSNRGKIRLKVKFVVKHVTNINLFFIQWKRLTCSGEIKNTKMIKNILERKVFYSFSEVLEWHCVKSIRIRSFSGPYFLVFSPNARKYGTKKLRIRTIFTQCGCAFFQKTFSLPIQLMIFVRVGRRSNQHKSKEI